MRTRRGHGAGLGFNRNYPLPEGMGDAQYLEALEQALQEVRAFRPSWLVVSLGVDVMRGDPTGSFVLTTQGMRRIGQALGRVGRADLGRAGGGLLPAQPGPRPPGFLPRALPRLGLKRAPRHATGMYGQDRIRFVTPVRNENSHCGRLAHTYATFVSANGQRRKFGAPAKR